MIIMTHLQNSSQEKMHTGSHRDPAESRQNPDSNRDSAGKLPGYNSQTGIPV